ncbi:MAG: carboxypeptidase regulatory-like domain-containing protein [Prevotella sp.]|nr:carboxypeptidase regulatory-like domain-containing protein [Prevotella sp.]
MKQTIYALVCCLCASIIATSCAKEEEVMTGTIIGLVSDYTNANVAIAGATVTINSKGLTKTTGSDGRYEFANLEPGTYSIQVSANTYQPTTKQITVYAGQTVNCDFQLEKSGADVEISPITLSFGQGVEQLSFTIKNNNNQALTYSVSNTPDYIEVSPTSGNVAAKSTQVVSVHVKDRSSITSNRSGQLTVNVGNNSYTVSINISNSVNTDPGQSGGDDNQGGNGNGNGSGNTDDIVVTRGLLAYYTFNDGKTATNVADPSLYNGQLNGTPEFSTGNNGTGYSIRLKKGQYITIPQNMVEGKLAYSISMWVKDFGQGCLYQTLKGTSMLSPTLAIDSDDKFRMSYGNSGWYNWASAAFSTEMTKYQEGGWHLITVVKNASNIVLLYIDGVNVDTQTCSDAASQGTSVTIGSEDTDAMYVDNVRIHGTALSSDEITTIYNAEK